MPFAEAEAEALLLARGLVKEMDVNGKAVKLLLSEFSNTVSTTILTVLIVDTWVASIVVSRGNDWFVTGRQMLKSSEACWGEPGLPVM